MISYIIKIFFLFYSFNLLNKLSFSLSLSLPHIFFFFLSIAIFFFPLLSSIHGRQASPTTNPSFPCNCFKTKNHKNGENPEISPCHTSNKQEQSLWRFPIWVYTHLHHQSYRTELQHFWGWNTCPYQSRAFPSRTRYANWNIAPIDVIIPSI